MRRKTVRAMVLCLAAVAILAMAVAPAEAKKRNVNPRVIPPQAVPYGHTYGEWCAKWWQWLATTPVPYSEGTGTNTGEGQSGPVWFLANNMTVTWNPDFDGYDGVGWADWSVTMPAGKALFFPVFRDTPMYGTDEAELRAAWDWWLSHVTELSATVDGRPLGDLFAYRAPSPLFPLGWVEGNIWQFDAAPPETAMEDGYWVLLAPLPPGQHVIHTYSKIVLTEDEAGENFRFVQDFTYHITVVPG